LSALSSVLVKFTADISELTGRLSEATQSIQQVGTKMTSIGETMSKAITIPLAAIGVAAYKAASDMDQAMDNIRAGTGATGKDLEALGENFKNVFKSVPASSETVSKALADLNIRTGITGKGLEDLTRQTMNLSRVAGEDASSLIASTTRVFGDWGVQNQDTGKTLDYLWKVSQSTGIGVGELANKIVQFGAPLRQMGFSLEESAALFGKWEKEGVNAELVAGSLRIALVRMAQDGQEPTEMFPKLIEQIKNAGSAGEANALAMEYFGARAGPDMAAAIREGRFELGDLMKALDASGETINKAAQDTLSFGESLTLMKNKATVALEPLGTSLIKVFDSMLPTLEKAINLVDRMAEAFANLPAGVQSAIVTFGLIVAAVGPMLIIVGKLVTAFVGIIPVLTKVGVALAGLNPITLLIVAGIAALVAIGVTLYKNWDTVKTFLTNTWNALNLLPQAN